MAVEINSDQRIQRLAPLTDVQAYIDAHVQPVRAARRDVWSARGLTLAQDVSVAQPLPAEATALRDGYAVESEMTRDASSYTPVIAPTPVFVDAGASLPPGTDAVLPQETVTVGDPAAEILSPATPGDGVLQTGADADPAAPLFHAGQRLRGIDIAALRAANISEVNVRVPGISLLRARPEDDRILDAALEWLAHAVTAAGGNARIGEDIGLDKAVQDNNVDAAIVIGGTGTGRRDDMVAALARGGDVAFHGVAMTPGETAAVGAAGRKPVLLIPGRLDAALAGWFFLGERMLARLGGREPDEQGRPARLTRKAASSLGVAEMIPVTCHGDDAEPLASTYLPLQILTRADGWISVPAQSEGYPAGAVVMVRPLP